MHLQSNYFIGNGKAWARRYISYEGLRCCEARAGRELQPDWEGKCGLCLAWRTEEKASEQAVGQIFVKGTELPQRCFIYILSARYAQKDVGVGLDVLLQARH